MNSTRLAAWGLLLLGFGALAIAPAIAQTKGDAPQPGAWVAFGTDSLVHIREVRRAATDAQGRMSIALPAGAEQVVVRLHEDGEGNAGSLQAALPHVVMGPERLRPSSNQMDALAGERALIEATEGTESGSTHGTLRAGAPQGFIAIETDKGIELIPMAKVEHIYLDKEEGRRALAAATPSAKQRHALALANGPKAMVHLPEAKNRPMMVDLTYVVRGPQATARPWVQWQKGQTPTLEMQVEVEGAQALADFFSGTATSSRMAVGADEVALVGPPLTDTAYLLATRRSYVVAPINAQGPVVGGPVSVAYAPPEKPRFNKGDVLAEGEGRVPVTYSFPFSPALPQRAGGGGYDVLVYSDGVAVGSARLAHAAGSVGSAPPLQFQVGQATVQYQVVATGKQTFEAKATNVVPPQPWAAYIGPVKMPLVKLAGR